MQILAQRDHVDDGRLGAVAPASQAAPIAASPVPGTAQASASENRRPRR